MCVLPILAHRMLQHHSERVSAQRRASAGSVLVQPAASEDGSGGAGGTVLYLSSDGNAVPGKASVPQLNDA